MNKTDTKQQTAQTRDATLDVGNISQQLLAQPSVGFGSPVVLAEAGSPEALERLVAGAERYFELLTRIQHAVLKTTSPHHWLDEGGNPYLTWDGAAKVAAGFGVSITNIRILPPETHTDEDGTYMIFSVLGTASWGGRMLEQIGMSTTRDHLLGSKNKEWLPLSEVDIPSVRKKAITNMFNRAVKSLLGLAFSWDELEDLSGGKISRSGTTGTNRTSGSKGGSTQAPVSGNYAAMQQKAHGLLLELCGGSQDAYKRRLKELTKWTDKEGKAHDSDTFKGMPEWKLEKTVLPAIVELHKHWVADQKAAQTK